MQPEVTTTDSRAGNRIVVDLVDARQHHACLLVLRRELQ